MKQKLRRNKIKPILSKMMHRSHMNHKVLSFRFKKVERSDSTRRHSIFDILRFCGSLFNPAFERLKPFPDRLRSCSGPALLPARAGRSDWKYEKVLSSNGKQIF
jgi:hypothetical protein